MDGGERRTGDGAMDAPDDDPCPDPTCYCEASGIVEALGRKYAIPVLCALGAHGTLRFGEVEDHLPTASTSTLSGRLDELEALGLVDRQQYDEVPPRVEYRMTADGRKLGRLLEPLVGWAAEREPSAVLG